MADKLACRGALSSARALALGIVMLAALVQVAYAHEIRPSIADVDIGEDSLTLDIQLTLESMVAGIDLDRFTNTNDAPQAARYDELRAMDPAALEAALRQAWPDLVGGFILRAGDAPVVPEIASIEISQIGDQDLPRDSVLHLTAALPADGTPVTVGWIAAYGPLVVRQTGEGEEAYSGYLTGGALSTPLPRDQAAQESAMTAFGNYVVLGFEHIVPKGLDHILFVLGLFFFSLHMRPLLLQVSAFTVAHTVTLAVATLGIVTVSPRIVEPLIAATIVYVAVENILFKKMTAWRTVVVFCFGLLHGLGFASVLGEIGLNPGRFISGLIGFNIGVELGQLAVILCAFLLVGLWFRDKPWYRSRVSVPASCVIAAIGAFWFIERIAG
jgi:hypothetical protein